MPFRLAFRLLRAAALVLLLLGAAIVIAFVVGKPYLEDEAGKVISRQLGGVGARVSVSPKLGFSLLNGEIGDVTVKTDGFLRQGLRIASVSATYRNASVSPSELLGGHASVRYSAVDLRADTGQPALQRYVRARLKLRGVPNASAAKVRVHTGGFTVTLAGLSVEGRATVVPPATVKLTAISGPSVLRSALTERINLAPLPAGVKLTAVELTAGHAAVTGNAQAGSVSVR